MRALIVEDDPMLGQALATGLSQLGHAVDWFTSGELADAELAVVPYDAMVLDLGLPGKDGLAWLKQWRAQGLMLPILVLTARDGVEPRIAGLDEGADDYLIKPISIDELAARLRALMRRRLGFVQSVWQHGALEYDAAAKAARWRGVAVDLTARETAVLEVLLANPHRVLSKAHLQRKLYNWTDHEPESNTLEVYVHHLRKKISPHIVRTVRGLGYALGSEESLT